MSKISPKIKIKDIRIELKSWEEAQGIIKRNRLNGDRSHSNVNELINELLISYKNKKISFKHSETLERKIRKVALKDEALDYYEKELPMGERTYLINGLLKRWISENREE